MFTGCSSAVNRNPLSSFAACRTRSSPLGSFPRLGVRFELSRSAFFLVGGLPSAISCGPPWPSLDRFVGTMPPYDSPPPFIWAL